MGGGEGLGQGHADEQWQDEQMLEAIRASLSEAPVSPPALVAEQQPEQPAQQASEGPRERQGERPPRMQQHGRIRPWTPRAAAPSALVPTEPAALQFNWRASVNSIQAAAPVPPVASLPPHPPPLSPPAPASDLFLEEYMYDDEPLGDDLDVGGTRGGGRGGRPASFYPSAIEEAARLSPTELSAAMGLAARGGGG